MVIQSSGKFDKIQNYLLPKKIIDYKREPERMTIMSYFAVIAFITSINSILAERHISIATYIKQ